MQVGDLLRAEPVRLPVVGRRALVKENQKQPERDDEKQITDLWGGGFIDSAADRRRPSRGAPPLPAAWRGMPLVVSAMIVTIPRP